MTVINTLAERGSRYGRFADHATIAQGIQDVMRAAPKWEQLDQDMKQALSVIADKIARILNGDPFYGDNWHDIQGYAKLIEDRINMIAEPVQELYEPVNPSPVMPHDMTEVPTQTYLPLHSGSSILTGGPTDPVAKLFQKSDAKTRSNTTGIKIDEIINLDALIKR